MANTDDLAIILTVLVIPACFLAASIIYLSVCYGYDLAVEEDECTQDRCCGCFNTVWMQL